MTATAGLALTLALAACERGSAAGDAQTAANQVLVEANTAASTVQPGNIRSYQQRALSAHTSTVRFGNTAAFASKAPAS